MKARDQFRNAYGIRLTRKNHLKLTALMLCLEVVLAFSYIGFIEIPPISVTTLSIPVVVAAMFFGPWDGAAVAAVFAFASMWKASLTSVEAGDLIFSPLLSGKPFESLLMALGARLLFGVIAGYLFRRFFQKERKRRGHGIAAIAVVSTAVHALLVYLCMTAFFGAAEVKTGSDFDRTLLVNNLILYAVTVFVALGCDRMMRNGNVRNFFSDTSSEELVVTKGQRRVSAILTAVIMLICLLICLHFISRIAGYLSEQNAAAGSGYVSWIYGLLFQFMTGFAAVFGIIILFLSWIQQYFSALTLRARKEERDKNELAENAARFFALEDDFESLYDVELESGRYISYVKGDFYQNTVIDKLVSPTDYFEDLRANIDSVIYPEDRDGLYGVLTRDAIRKELDANDHFDYCYRIITDNGPMWLKIRLVYKNGEKKNIITGVFNAEEEIAAKKKETEQRELTELQLRHEQLRGEVLNYMMDHGDDDPIELLKNFAERIRVLLGCDQVIYRDLEETRIMVNSDGIAETWSVPIEYCRQCQHFDAHHPMYALGYTEMDNCQEGWQGIPVYEKCPIKSSLTRIVYCDGKVAGYLAIHFVTGYHRFSDSERRTLEEFTRILSISLSRFEAKKENRQLKLMQQMQTRLDEDMQLISGLASGYDALYYVNIDEDLYNIYRLDEEKYRGSHILLKENTGFWQLVREYGQSEHIHPDDRQLFAGFDAGSVRQKLTGTKKYSLRFRVDTGSGYRWDEMDVVKYENANERANAIAVGFADRDADIRREQEYQQQLEKARETADAANRSKSAFLFNMSHDIRTPMNAIRGFTAMAKKHAEDEKQVTEYLDKIDISGQQLLTLINQVLEMARIESGKIVLEEKPVNVRNEFRSMVTVLAEQAKTNGLKFIYTIGNIEHENVLADEARMSSITLNITGNAMKYTPAGGTIEYSLKELAPRKPGYATFVFTVSDTGIGMSQEYLKHLYEPFTREKSSTVSRIQGTGLGMPIVKSMVDLMGGTIEVQSETGKGTRFDVMIDFRIDETDGRREEETENFRGVSFRGRRVLLVEDNEMNREIAKDILEEQGLLVEDAEDGDVAVEMVRKTVSRGDPGYYDFILMDVQMPRMNGYEATKAIRAIPFPADVHIPIIAMTANAFAEDRQDALNAGMDEHITKPIDVQKMFDTIARFL